MTTSLKVNKNLEVFSDDVQKLKPVCRHQKNYTALHIFIPLDHSPKTHVPVFLSQCGFGGKISYKNITTTYVSLANRTEIDEPKNKILATLTTYK